MGLDRAPVHVAIIPWLAFGHMIPFLHLAVALAGAGLRISFLCTPRNIRRLPKVPAHLTVLITFVELPLPSVDGLPDDAEATVDVPPDDVRHLKTAFDLLQDPIRRFIAASSPDWLVHDFIPYWAPALGRESGVPSVLFSVFSAAAQVFFGPPELYSDDGLRRWRSSPESMTSSPEWVPFPSTVAFRQWEAEFFHAVLFTKNASGVRDIDRKKLALDGCQAVAVRSCSEYEGEYLELLGRMYGKPVIPVGLLPPETTPAAGAGGGDHGRDKILLWLDGQEPKSVVFVSFGSEYKMTETEVHELAHGLELSRVPFLWVLRRPAWLMGDDAEALPPGFTGRTESRGLVIFGWAPQLEILAHPSIGGSLFHSGWGSVIETLRHGHALILLPAVFDQGLNARLLVEKGLAVEVERDKDGSFDSDGVASSLRMVMVSEEGKEMRRKAREMATVFGDEEVHGKYLRGFAGYLLNGRKW